MSTTADNDTGASFTKSNSTATAAPPSYVVVFPSIFAKKAMRQLAANIKIILKIREQQFQSVSRDGDVILVHAHDPVFAASAIGLLFGVSRVAIARQTGTKLDELVQSISSVGGNLLLRGDRFLVRVEGATKGYTAKDAEIAATSKIISRNDHGATPGTEDDHDKELYAYVSKKNSYMCIFSDGGSWGIPTQKGTDKQAVCAIYDELSTVSCFECMRIGYDAKIIIFYKKRSDLLNLARLLNRLIPRMLTGEAQMTFVKMTGNSTRQSRMAYVERITEFVLVHYSKAGGRVSLAVPPGVYPAEVAEALTMRVFERGMTPVVPLAGSGVGMYDTARELSFDEAAVKRLEEQIVRASAATLNAKPAGATPAPKAADIKTITVKVGANNIHDILDSLYPPP